jgi:putative tricarboxylic transport membrane protein
MTSYMDGLLLLAGPVAILLLILGTIVGLVIGSIPGIGPTLVIALLLPFVFGWAPHHALIFLTSLYQAAEYGGSISAIAAGTPGTANSAAMILDGYAMNRRGEAGKAFGYSLWASVISAFVTNLLILAIAVPVSNLALAAGPRDLAAVGFVALMLVGILSRGSPLKGLVSAALGLLLSTVGIDVLSGEPRFAFGSPTLMSGVPLIPLMVGLFALSSAVELAIEPVSADAKRTMKHQRVRLSWQEWVGALPNTGIGMAIGFLLGIIPGMAGTVPPWISYATAKTLSKNPDQFGYGAPGGITAPEATNGADMHAALVPAFFLGLPGTATSAVILGAMTIVGLQPGPLVYVQHSDIVLAVFEALTLGSVLVFVFGLFVTSAWANLIGRIDPRLLAIGILVLVTMGSYTATSDMFGVYVALAAGIAGFVLKELNFSLPALVVGFVIGGPFEANLGRGLLIAHGSVWGLLDDPFVLAMVALGLAIAGYTIWSRQRRPSAAAELQS